MIKGTRALDYNDKSRDNFYDIMLFIFDNLNTDKWEDYAESFAFSPVDFSGEPNTTFVTTVEEQKEQLLEFVINYLDKNLREDVMRKFTYDVKTYSAKYHATVFAETQKKARRHLRNKLKSRGAEIELIREAEIEPQVFLSEKD